MGALANRKIIHLDLDAFFCAVEELYEPSLAGKPFAVGGRPEGRGVVASCSYPARRHGVHSAMPMAQALRLCPNLLVLPARHGVYRAMSRQVMRHVHLLTSLVEQISIDEAFLDVTALPAPAAELAQRLQAPIQTELSLPCSLGVATNKLVAKIANNVGKAAARGDGPPNAIQVVPPGREAEFLAPLPADALWGVGPKTAERLAELGMRTIGDIAAWPVADLARRFGKHGEDLARRARGIDDRPVVTEHERKSVSQETTFARDIDDRDALRRTVQELAEGVSRHLQRQRLAGTTVKLKLRWPDFTTVTRQTTLDQPTDQAADIGRSAQQLFDRIWVAGRPVRLLGVGVSGLHEGPRQLSLWDQPDEKEERLLAAVALLRRRFGADVVQRASAMARSDDDDSE